MAETLRLEDVRTFLAVLRLKSISAAARQERVTPSQVSKAVARLEAYVGAPLLRRSARGVTTTWEALAVVPRLEQLARSAEGLRGERADESPVVRVATVSSLGPPLARVLATSLTDVRAHCLELDVLRMRALAYEDVFDAALVVDGKELGEGFVHEPLGEARSVLFARPSYARTLGKGPLPQERLATVPFVVPLVLTDPKILPGDDRCPLPVDQRLASHGAGTFATALELVASSDAVLFGPRIAGQPYVARGALAVVEVEGWDVRWPLHLACHATRMSAKTARKLKDVLVRWLARVEDDG